MMIDAYMDYKVIRGEGNELENKDLIKRFSRSRVCMCVCLFVCRRWLVDKGYDWFL